MAEEVWYAQLRERWRPDTVSLLLIGESAPAASDTHGRRFFYSDALTRRDALFRGVVEAVLGASTLDSRTTTKEPWLAQLRDRGVFLIDLVPYPVSELGRAARARARRENAANCVARAAALQPAGVIICHKPSFEVLRAPMLAAALPLLHDEGFPFPLGNWRADFVRSFREALERLASPSG